MRLATIDELHRLAERVLAETAEMPAEQKKKQIVDEVYEMLVLAYIFGSDRVLGDIELFEEENDIPQERREEIRREMLRETGGVPQETAENTPKIPVSAQELYETIYKPIAGETFEERIDRRLREGALDSGTLGRILETDYHRCEETGAYNTAKGYGKASGREPYKIWRTMQDNRVRETHWYIDDTEVPLDNRFYTFDGDSARFPGDFELVENNANCRCWLSYTFR